MFENQYLCYSSYSLVNRESNMLRWSTTTMAVMRRSLRERIYLTFRLVILANCFGEKNILRKKNMEGKVIVLVREKKKTKFAQVTYQQILVLWYIVKCLETWVDQKGRRMTWTKKILCNATWLKETRITWLSRNWSFADMDLLTWMYSRNV